MGLAAVALITVLPAQAETPREAAAVGNFRLDNGMEVVVIPDHRAPIVTHMVWYRVGSADEPPGKSGIAHFFEHLMFKGTKNSSSRRVRFEGRGDRRQRECVHLLRLHRLYSDGHAGSARNGDGL